MRRLLAGEPGLQESDRDEVFCLGRQVGVHCDQGVGLQPGEPPETCGGPRDGPVPAARDGHPRLAGASGSRSTHATGATGATGARITVPSRRDGI
jgi:hypothetical protein